MKKRLLLIGGLITASLATVALLSSCTATSTGTTSSTSSTQSFLIMIGFIVLLFVMMYFLTIRPQRKRQQEHQKMMQAIQRGDRVITIGGLYGTVESINEDSVTIKVEGGTTMRFIKSAIASKLNEEMPQAK